MINTVMRVRCLAQDKTVSAQLTLNEQETGTIIFSLCQTFTEKVKLVFQEKIN